MDVNNNVDDIIASAWKANMEGNYKSAIALLEPLLKGEKKKGKTLSPTQELNLASSLSASHRCLQDYKASLPHAKRRLELAIQLRGKGSKEHAMALRALGMVDMGFKDFKGSKKRFNDAMTILSELGMEKSADYGDLLFGLAQVDIAQQRWKEALEGFIKAKAVMDNFKEHPDYGSIVNDMAVCYKNLNQWTEALQYYREAVEIDRKLRGDQHPSCATTIYNLALACPHQTAHNCHTSL